MSHGFTRFGPPSARDRFHQQMRPAGTLAMILPTIFATLFMFTVVVTLNKAGNMSRGGKIVRLLDVDDIFPTQLDVEQNRKKEFWELTPPPPSPEAVMKGQEPAVPQFTLESEIRSSSEVFSDSYVSTDLRPEIPPPSRTLPSIKTELQLPAVAPDTSLPAATPTP